MKKFFIISIMLSLSCVVKAQTEYSVSTPTMEQKFNVSQMHMNNIILAHIAVAKSDGMIPAELGKKIGKVFSIAWDENGGYEPYVNFILYGWSCLADGVQIIEQSDEKLVVLVSSLYKPVEDQGVLFGASVEDFAAYFNAMLNEIAVHYAQSIEMTRGEEGYKIVITL